VEFVSDVQGEELGVELAAALDHEAADAALAEVVEHGSEVDGGPRATMSARWPSWSVSLARAESVQ